MNFEEEAEKLKLKNRALELKVYNLTATLKRHNLAYEAPIDNNELYKNAYSLLIHYQSENENLKYQLNQLTNRKDDDIVEWRTKYESLSEKCQQLTEKNHAQLEDFLAQEKHLNDEITSFKFKVLSLQDQNDELIKINESLQKALDSNSAEKSFADTSFMMSEYRDSKRSEIYKKWKVEANELKEKIYNLNQNLLEANRHKDEAKAEIQRLSTQIQKNEEDHKNQIISARMAHKTSILDLDDQLSKIDIQKVLGETCSRIIKDMTIHANPIEKETIAKHVQFNDFSMESTLGESDLKSPLISHDSDQPSNQHSEFTDCDLSDLGQIGKKYVPNATSTQLRSDIPPTPNRDSIFVTPTNIARQSMQAKEVDKSVTEQSVVFGQNIPADIHSYITGSAQKIYSIVNDSRQNSRLDENTFVKMKHVYQDLAHSIQLLDSIISNKKCNDPKLQDDSKLKALLVNDCKNKFLYLENLLTGQIEEEQDTNKENQASFEYNDAFERLKKKIIQCIETHREISGNLERTKILQTKITQNVEELLGQV